MVYQRLDNDANRELNPEDQRYLVSIDSFKSGYEEKISRRLMFLGKIRRPNWEIIKPIRRSLNRIYRDCKIKGYETAAKRAKEARNQGPKYNVLDLILEKILS